jgi:hypothetical protein
LAWSTQGGGSTASLLSCPAPLADPASPFSSCAHSISQWGQAEQDATRWCEVTSACVCVLAHVCSRAPYQSCCLCLWHPLPWVRPPLWTLGSSAWGRVGLVSDGARVGYVTTGARPGLTTFHGCGLGHWLLPLWGVSKVV